MVIALLRGDINTIILNKVRHFIADMQIFFNHKYTIYIELTTLPHTHSPTE